jgi:tetratricopeptide (TPR) repeat protein
MGVLDVNGAFGPDAQDERALRGKILAGSQDLRDYRKLASILVESGKEEEALAVLERAIGLPVPASDRAAISAEMAWILYGLSRRECAMTMALAALSDTAQSPDTAETLMIRGLSYATLAASRYHVDPAGSDREAGLAIEAFDKLLSGHPRFEDMAVACRHAAGVYAMQKEYAKAIALYQEAIRREPSERNRAYCLVCIGRALCFQGHFDEAESRLREALGLATVDDRLLPRIYFELGRVQRLANRSDGAMTALEQAVSALHRNRELHSDQDLFAEIKWELGNLYYDAGRYEEAISALREAVPHLPAPYPYFDTLISLGHLYLLTGQYARARDCYQEVLISDQASKEERATAEEGLSRLPPLPPPLVH